MTEAQAPLEGADLLAGSPELRRRYLAGRLGRALTGTSLLLAALFLGIFLWDVLQRGLPALDLHFVTSTVSSFPDRAGVANAIVGSALLMLVTMALAGPVGVAAAVYLEEFAAPTQRTHALQLFVENLAGVPSIVFGLLGYSVFVLLLGLQRSLLAAGLTLGAMSLPIIVVAAQEALASVPQDFRDAARGLGATDWQVVRDHVLPNALPGILTGAILAMSRAIGETAPILFMASVFTRGFPGGLLDGFVALPTTIFTWAKLPQEAWHANAAAAILVLLAVLLLLNAAAVALRQWSLSRRHW